MLNGVRGSGFGVRGLVAGFTALALSLGACRGMDASLNSRMAVYATVDEARADGAIQRGIVPEGLPAGASDFRVAYLGNGTHWGVFAFPPAQADALRALVGPENTAGPATCNAPGRFEWWPRLLQDPIDLTAVHATGLRLYVARDGRRAWAINWNQGRAYYWKE